MGSICLSFNSGIRDILSFSFFFYNLRSIPELVRNRSFSMICSRLFECAEYGKRLCLEK